MSQYLTSSLLEVDVLLGNIKETIDSLKHKPAPMPARVTTPPAAPSRMPAPHIRRCSFDMPPEYSATESRELALLSPASSVDSAPPVYAALDESSSSGFSPTRVLQIQAAGVPVVRLPVPPRPEPIYIFTVAPDGQSQQAEYVSIRPSRDSGSCFLARADDATQAILCATTYRFGPGKPPKMRIPKNQAGNNAQDSEFELVCKGYFSRTITMRTHLGTFEWRYGSRSERKSARSTADEDIDCLLLLEQITNVVLEGGKQEERRTKVGQFVRSASLRTPGSKKSSAGNGGRLMLDLRAWADTKGDGEQMEILAVASCVSMMKKEVDRRRTHQAMALSAGAAG